MKAPFLIIIGGAPGSGKSTVAKIIKKDTKAKYFVTDDIRKLKKFQNAAAEYKKLKMPSKNVRRDIYLELFKTASKNLENKHSVMLEATFNKPWTVKLAKEVAKKNHARLIKIEISLKGLDERLIEERLNNRIKRDKKAASADMYTIFNKNFVSFASKKFTIENSSDINYLKDRINEILKTIQK